MHRVKNYELPGEINNSLEAYQDEVLKKSTFDEQKSEAKRLWNSKDRELFSKIRDNLKKMAPVEGCCMYCESVPGNQIEHFRPKSRYPECAFQWDNFLPACGECNLKKRSSFRVYRIDKSSWYDVPPKGDPRDRRFGRPALLNPRFEDSMALLGLELRDTFLFYSRYPKGTTEYDRAHYTVHVLGLNNNEILRSLRQNAYHAYVSHLERYVSAAGQPEKRAHAKKLILGIPQATVWWEMKRQYQNRHHEFNCLFEQAPEARLWSHKWVPGHDQTYLDKQAANSGKYLFSGSP